MKVETLERQAHAVEDQVATRRRPERRLAIGQVRGVPFDFEGAEIALELLRAARDRAHADAAPPQFPDDLATGGPGGAKDGGPLKS